MTRGRRYGSGRLWQRGSVWVLDYRGADGDRHRQHLGPNKRDAERQRVEIIAKRDRILGGFESAPQDIALGELRDRYVEDLATRVTPMHLVNVEQALERILLALPARTVSELQPADVLAFRAERIRQRKSNRTANYAVQCLRGMVRWAVDTGLANADPLKSIRHLPDGPRHQKNRRRALTEAEVSKLIAAAEDEDAVLGASRARVPQAPMWVTLVQLGLRYGELRQARWSDLDEARATLLVRGENVKTGRERMIPLPTELVERIAALRLPHRCVLGRAAGPNDHIFLSALGKPWWRASNNANRSLERLLERVGIAKVDERGRVVSVHALRHTCASRFARAGVSSLQAKRILGHASSRITEEVYQHVETEDLRGVLEAVPVIGAARSA